MSCKAWHSVFYHVKGGERRIELTRLNGKGLTINSDLIEMIEETPDTVITLTTGKKIIVKESRQMVKNLVKLYRQECNSTDFVE